MSDDLRKFFSKNRFDIEMLEAPRTSIRLNRITVFFWLFIKQESTKYILPEQVKSRHVATKKPQAEGLGLDIHYLLHSIKLRKTIAIIIKSFVLSN